MRRREFIAAIGIVAASRVTAHAQATPVIGFLSNASADGYGLRLRAFRQGLREAGFVEGQNVTIEFRWANGVNAQLPALATELARQNVRVIVAGGGRACSQPQSPGRKPDRHHKYERADRTEKTGGTPRVATCCKPDSGSA